ncbi:hypothetical protein [Pedococcus bigeumensis]|uniref:hypothetical protein n=1 Tax=Pedococcus bigeumensis TaxID=433644 RepID=UPI002FE9FB62
MTIESQLREALSARADEMGGSVADPYARVSGAIATDRRRRRTAALAGVAAVAALAVAIPSLSSGLGADRTSPAKRTGVIVPGPQDPRWASVYTWPTRGSLADDADFLRSFREVMGNGAVVFAGDIEGDRVVVAWSRAEDGTETAKVWAGDRGAAATTLQSVSSASQSDSSAIIVRRDPTPSAWMLVLARAGVRTAEVSPSAVLALDGTVSRTWQTVKLEDGAAVVDLHDAPISLTRVRVGRFDGGMYLPARLGPVQTTTPDGFCGNCTGQDFLDHAQAGTSDGVANIFGVDPGTVTTTTLVNSAVDSSVLAVTGLGDEKRSGTTGRIYVGLTRLPGGQVVRTVNLGVEQKEGGGASTGLEEGVPLDAATAEQRPVVLHGSKPGSGVTRYQVFAPGAARVQLVSDVPSLYPTSGKVAVVDGSAVLSTPSWADGTATPYRVATFDAAGNQLDTWPLDLPGLDDPYDLRP